MIATTKEGHVIDIEFGFVILTDYLDRIDDDGGLVLGHRVNRNGVTEELPKTYLRPVSFKNKDYYRLDVWS